MTVSIVSAASALTCTGCHAHATTGKQLTSNHPLDRAQAAVRAAEHGDTAPIHALVDLLEDSDDVVRMVAIHSLRRLCGEDFGYRYYADAPERAAAVLRWRAALRDGAIRVAAEWPASPDAAGADPVATPPGEDTSAQ